MSTLSSTIDAKATTDEWGGIAKDYANQINRLTSLYANDLIILLHPYIVKAKVILDIGCGAGAFVHAYMQQYPQGIPGQTIISSDLSPSMLDQARLSTSQALQTGKHAFETNLVFQEEDGTKLDGIADGSIDIVVSLYAVFLIPDQAATLQSIHRVLKSDTGVFANAAWTVPAHDIDPTFGGNFQLSFAKAVTTMSSFSATHKKEAPSIVDQEHPNRQWINPDQIIRNLSQQKFGSTEIYRIFHSMVWSSFESLYDITVHHPLCSVNPETTEEQLTLLRQTLWESCIPLEQQRQLLQTSESSYAPFVLWTSANLSLSHMNMSSKHLDQAGASS